MKITKKQLELLIKEAVLREDTIEAAKEAYVALVHEALEKETSHLQKKWPELADGELQWFLGNIIGAYLFNHQKELPGQFNPQKKWVGYYEDDKED